MARFPGTEKPVNRKGWQVGQVVRFRRSRANGDRDLADRRGFVTEVRAGAARVLIDAAGASTWIESESLLPEEHLQCAELERLRQVFLRLDGQRLERDDEEWSIFSPGFSAGAVDAVRELLGARLEHFTLESHGVHELAARLRLSPPRATPE